MDEKKKVVAIGHKDQAKSFQLLFENRNEVDYLFLDIDVFFQNTIADTEDSVNPFYQEDRYVMGTFAPLIHHSNFNKQKQLNYIKKLNLVVKTIFEKIIIIRPNLVLLERNNFIGQSLGEKLNQSNILNGWFLPVRLSNNLVYLEQGYLDKPYQFLNRQNDSEFIISKPEYLKQHKVNSLFDFFRKRNYYKSTRDYRKYLYKPTYYGRIYSFLKRYRAFKFFNNISVNKFKEGIFYYLHHQPEFALESTDYKWYDQVQKVREIRREIPLYIPLYLKESPSMFLKRSMDDLIELWKLPNTYFVSHKTENANLYPFMRAAITFSGTIALESVLNGIPSFIFKKTWFSEVEGIFYLNHITELSVSLSLNLDKQLCKDKSLIQYKSIISKIAIKGKTFGNGRPNENKSEADSTYSEIIKIIQ